MTQYLQHWAHPCLIDSPWMSLPQPVNESSTPVTGWRHWPHLWVLHYQCSIISPESKNKKHENKTQRKMHMHKNKEQKKTQHKLCITRTRNRTITPLLNKNKKHKPHHKLRRKVNINKNLDIKSPLKLIKQQQKQHKLSSS